MSAAAWPFAAMICPTSGRSRVSVPVLSNRTVSISQSRSSARPSFTNTPRCAHSASVESTASGAAIRMPAPLAMLSTLALCAQRGVLVKDGRALDLLCEIDTVLFDKTGTLTRERPEVGRIIAANGHAAADILRYAAAAEHRFHHPIALAILQKAEE